MLARGEQKYRRTTVSLRRRLMIVSAFLFKGRTSDRISLPFPPPYLNSLELGNGSLRPAPSHRGGGGGETGFWNRILINDIKGDPGRQKIRRAGETFRERGKSR